MGLRGSRAPFRGPGVPSSTRARGAPGLAGSLAHTKVTLSLASPFPWVTCPVENVPNLRPSRAPGSYPTETICRRETLATAQACSPGLTAAVGRGWRALRGVTWEKPATGAEQEG